MQEQTRRGIATKDRKTTRFYELVSLRDSRWEADDGVRREMTYPDLCFSFPKCDDSPYQDFNGRAKVNNQEGKIQVY